MSEPRDYTIHLIGHGHIDPVWQWPWSEGYEEVRATFMSALKRMNEDDDVTFTAGSACLYQWVKQSDPGIFEEIKQRVDEGRWELAGGMWIEPDCNIPSGESIVRQGFYGQRFFQEEFGRAVTVGFNPDSFGHAGTLPQILTQLGMDAYVFMRPMPRLEMEFPEGATFYWLANDGSRILTTAIPESYNGTRSEVMDRIKRLPDWPHLIRNQHNILCFYGVGNHGGGPTKRTIEALHEAQDNEALPRLVFSRLDNFFDGVRTAHQESVIPIIDSDLQHHARGCYAAHSGIKRLNRRTEHELMLAERIASICWLVHQRPYPTEALDQAWQDLLFNQFHDILAGTSIQAAYEDARDQLGRARFTAREITIACVQSIATDIDTSAGGNAILVFNPYPWPTRQVVEAPPLLARGINGSLYVTDENGRVIANQEVDGPHVGSTSYAFTVDLPGLGHRCYYANAGTKRTRGRGHVTAEDHAIENDRWRIEFDVHDGAITRLYDKKSRVEVIDRGAVLAVLADHTDTWSHGHDEWRTELGRFGNASVRVYETGDVRATLHITSTYNHSVAHQFVTLYNDIEEIDWCIHVDWREKHAVLKWLFDTNIRNAAVTADTAYGVQGRAANGTEQPCQMWVDLTGAVNGKTYGFGLINDSKYSFDARAGTLRMTLLRSPVYCHHDPDRVDASRFNAYMDQGIHDMRFRLVPHPGPWESTNIARSAWELNSPAFVHLESSHRGELEPAQTYLECDMDYVALTVFKKGHDGDHLIVRGYETAGQDAKGEIRLPSLGASLGVTFAPHAIRTWRYTIESGEWAEVNLLEEEI